MACCRGSFKVGAAFTSSTTSPIGIPASVLTCWTSTGHGTSCRTLAGDRLHPRWGILDDVQGHPPDHGLRPGGAQGYQVFNINYRLGPVHTYPKPLQDAMAALEWVLDNGAKYGADTDRLAIIGESAGANLAAALAYCTTHPRPEPFTQSIFERDVRPRLRCALVRPARPARRPALLARPGQEPSHGELDQGRDSRHCLLVPGSTRETSPSVSARQPTAPIRETGRRWKPAPSPVLHHGRDRRPAAGRHDPPQRCAPAARDGMRAACLSRRDPRIQRVALACRSARTMGARYLISSRSTCTAPSPKRLHKPRTMCRCPRRSRSSRGFPPRPHRGAARWPCRAAGPMPV